MGHSLRSSLGPRGGYCDRQREANAALANEIAHYDTSNHPAGDRGSAERMCQLVQMIGVKPFGAPIMGVSSGSMQCGDPCGLAHLLASQFMGPNDGRPYVRAMLLSDTRAMLVS